MTQSFSCKSDSLASLIESLKESGVDESQFKRVTIELDWDGCYYEGDTPSIKAVYDDGYPGQ